MRPASKGSTDTCRRSAPSSAETPSPWSGSVTASAVSTASGNRRSVTSPAIVTGRPSWAAAIAAMPVRKRPQSSRGGTAQAASSASTIKPARPPVSIRVIGRDGAAGRNAIPADRPNQGVGRGTGGVS